MQHKLLKHHLTAIRQSFLHGRMCQRWGYLRLAEYHRKHSIMDMLFVEQLVDRILELKGIPDLADLGPIRVGRNVREQLENDLSLAREAVLILHEEAGSEEMLAHQEQHIDYLEGQIHAIQEAGLDHYLAQQI